LKSLLGVLQAGLPRLDFGDIQGAEKQRYFSAIQVSMDKNYEPIIEVFYKVIKKTLKLYEK